LRSIRVICACLPPGRSLFQIQPNQKAPQASALIRVTKYPRHLRLSAARQVPSLPKFHSNHQTISYDFNHLIAINLGSPLPEI